MKGTMPARSCHAYAVTIIAAVALLASCSTPDGPQEPTVNTITQTEAERMTEDYVRQAVAALASDIRLEVIIAGSSPCTDPSDNGPSGRVFASNRYWVRGLPKEQNQQSVQTLLNWTRQQGFAVQSDAWDSAKVITMEKETDGFRMAIQESAEGDLSIGASSPCVWPNGTPQPKPGN